MKRPTRRAFLRGLGLVTAGSYFGRPLWSLAQAQYTLPPSGILGSDGKLYKISRVGRDPENNLVLGLFDLDAKRSRIEVRNGSNPEQIVKTITPEVDSKQNIRDIELTDHGTAVLFANGAVVYVESGERILPPLGVVQGAMVAFDERNGRRIYGRDARRVHENGDVDLDGAIYDCPAGGGECTSVQCGQEGSEGALTDVQIAENGDRLQLHDGKVTIFNGGSATIKATLSRGQSLTGQSSPSELIKGFRAGRGGVVGSDWGPCGIVDPSAMVDRPGTLVSDQDGKPLARMVLWSPANDALGIARAQAAVLVGKFEMDKIKWTPPNAANPLGIPANLVIDANAQIVDMATGQHLGGFYSLSVFETAIDPHFVLDENGSVTAMALGGSAAMVADGAGAPSTLLGVVTHLASMRFAGAANDNSLSFAHSATGWWWAGSRFRAVSSRGWMKARLRWLGWRQARLGLWRIWTTTSSLSVRLRFRWRSWPRCCLRGRAWLP